MVLRLLLAGTLLLGGCAGTKGPSIARDRGRLVGDGIFWPDLGAGEARGAPDRLVADARGKDLPHPPEARLIDSAPPSFVDVPPGSPNATEILWVAQKGYMIGCSASPPSFCPTDPLSRAQAAVSLVRMKFGETFGYAATPHFTDVPASHSAFKYVQKLFEAGITAGCGTALYCPSDPLLRGQAASFIATAKFGSSYPYPTTPVFNDVPASHPHFPAVQKLYQAGITAGCTASLYCPDQPTRRDQWAVFLYRVQTL